MTFEELKAEANRQGFGLHRLRRGMCLCIIGRDEQLSKGRSKCLKYEFDHWTKSYCHCKRKEDRE